MTTWTRISIDQHRAAGLLRDFGVLALAVLPFTIGLLLALIVTVLSWLWLGVLWLVGAGIAGYETVRPRR